MTSKPYVGMLDLTPLMLAATLFLAGVLQAEASPLIESYTAKLRDKGQLTIAGQELAAVRTLPAFYAARDYRAVWSSGERAEEMRRLIEAATTDGLDPADYHAEVLDALAALGGLSEQQRAERELLLTDALMRLVYHLEFGKVDPEKLYSDWQFGKSIDGLDAVAIIDRIVNAPDLAQAIDAHRPEHLVYSRLRNALLKYQQLADVGGWQPVPSGPALKPGMQDARVAALRRRLMASGDLAREVPVTDEFDTALEAAVKRFQARHRLTADGVVGKATLEALNVSAGERVDQLRVNLERARWILHDIKDGMIIADIAGFEVFEIEDGQITWRTLAQVGKPYRKTPVFKSEIRYLEFNPTWTIPPTILRKDILPRLKKDPGYLSTKGIRVLDQQGRRVDASTIDWSRYPEQSFPYILRQDPGPKNALGRVKFIFPNPHFVYMHDTPSKALFNRAERSFSSGCIRIQEPFILAERLLQDPQRWNQETIQEVLDSLKTTRVNLPKPMPVALMYWTAGTEPDGSVFFKADPYDRDAAVLAALNSPPVFTPPAQR